MNRFSPEPHKEVGIRRDPSPFAKPTKVILRLRNAGGLSAEDLIASLAGKREDCYDDDVELNAMLARLDLTKSENIRLLEFPGAKAQEPERFATPRRKALAQRKAADGFSLAFIPLLLEFSQEAESLDPKLKQVVPNYVEQFRKVLRNRQQSISVTRADNQKDLTIEFVLSDSVVIGAPTDGSIGSGGPGSIPYMVKPSAYQAVLAEAHANGIHPDSPGVRIYILDTVYPDSLQDHLNFPHRAPATHPRVKQWWNQTEHIDTFDPGLHRHRLVRVADVFKTAFPSATNNTNQAGEATTEFLAGRLFGQSQTFKLYDHGPFIADIILRAAPDAELVFVETLNEYGRGSCESFFAAMKWVYEDLKTIPSSCRPACLINVSIADTQDEVEQPNETDEQLLHDLWSDMVEIVTTVDSTISVQMFAAAGNDSNGDAYRKRPGFPAVLQDVLGVAAGGQKAGSFSLTTYSNLPDGAYNVVAGNGFALLFETPQVPAPAGGVVADAGAPAAPPFEKGIATFGGEIVITLDNTGCYNIEGGVVGPYIATPPSTPENNHEGYVQWAGTSFATARITGRYAAEILYNPHSYPPGTDLIDQVDARLRFGVTSKIQTITYINNGVRLSKAVVLIP